jgi:GntR family transcriptional regulator
MEPGPLIEFRLVHRAYRDLEQQGLTEGRPGSGTFVKRTLSKVPDEQPLLLGRLEEWIRAARAAGLGDEAIAALMAEAMKAATDREAGGEESP